MRYCDIYDRNVAWERSQRLTTLWTWKAERRLRLQRHEQELLRHRLKQKHQQKQRQLLYRKAAWEFLYSTLDVWMFFAILACLQRGVTAGSDWLGMGYGIGAVILSLYYLYPKRCRMLRRAGLLWLPPHK